MGTDARNVFQAHKRRIRPPRARAATGDLRPDALLAEPSASATRPAARPRSAPHAIAATRQCPRRRPDARNVCQAHRRRISSHRARKERHERELTRKRCRSPRCARGASRRRAGSARLGAWPTPTGSASSWPTTTASCARGCRLLLDQAGMLEVIAEAGAMPTAALRSVLGHKSRASSCSISTCPGSRRRSTSSARRRRVAGAPGSWSSPCRRTRSSPARRFARGARATSSRRRPTTSSSRRVRRAAAGETSTSNPKLGAPSPPRPPERDGPPERPHRARRSRSLRLVALGHTNSRDCRSQLYLSVRTVESHRSRIGQKLRCLDPGQARALRAGPWPAGATPNEKGLGRRGFGAPA